MGLVAPRHVGSSRTRDGTCVPCIGRRILNHCATREVPTQELLKHTDVAAPPQTDTIIWRGGDRTGFVKLPGQTRRIPAVTPSKLQTVEKKDKILPPVMSTGSRRAGSAVVAHGPSRSTACGIFPDQGSNPCPLHRQADSQPLRHQGSPHQCFKSSGASQSLGSAHPMENLMDTMGNAFMVTTFLPIIIGDSPSFEAHRNGGQKLWGRASLVAQWLRICLPMQRTRVRALVWEDPTCRGATRPVSHSY
ncbi:hypothetical protein J1605_006139 [Eschrichtius robustus]|uniref:Uncharacterized protein n=1 Tax=Eschrichtius robustus TaxID=9764 RepID=A0AB34H6U8_ESCRO|nr:hypothetical protein J1605_006139 [Eschrichtius robustus]